MNELQKKLNDKLGELSKKERKEEIKLNKKYLKFREYLLKKGFEEKKKGVLETSLNIGENIIVYKIYRHDHLLYIDISSNMEKDNFIAYLNYIDTKQYIYRLDDDTIVEENNNFNREERVIRYQFNSNKLKTIIKNIDVCLEYLIIMTADFFK